MYMQINRVIKDTNVFATCCSSSVIFTWGYIDNNVDVIDIGTEYFQEQMLGLVCWANQAEKGVGVSSDEKPCMGNINSVRKILFFESIKNADWILNVIIYWKKEKRWG